MTTFRSAEALALSGGDALTHKLRNLAARPAALSLRELIDRYMADYRGRDSTRAQRLAAWCALLGDFTLEQLDADLVHAARQELRAQPALAFKGNDFAGQPIFRAKRAGQAKSSATLNRYAAALSAVCTWAIEQRLAPRTWVHPCRGIRRLPEPDGRVRFLDDAERTLLLEACKTSEYPRLHAFVLTAICTGARRGELLALRWADVDLEAGFARLAATKNGDRRILVLLPQVVEALTPFRSDEAERYVFGSVRARYRAPAQLDTAWRHAVRRAQLKNFRLHDLRHTCASYLAQAGVPLNVIAEVLGHRKLDMTRRYAHLTTATKAAAMRAVLGDIR